MSDGRAAATAAGRVGSGAGRLHRAWRNLPADRRLAAYAALGLFVTLFLPWYQEAVIAPSASNHLQAVGQSLTGWAAFSFVEAAVLVVAVGVLTLLFQRAEGRAFHLPGGDGGVIMAAGLWTCLLVIWRIFDKQGTSGHGAFATTSGIEWGIFVALAVAAFLAYAGTRIRAAHQPEPPLPGEDDPREPDGRARDPDRRGPEGRVRPALLADWGEPAGDPPPLTRRRQPPERPVGWLSADPEGRATDADGRPRLQPPAPHYERPVPDDPPAWRPEARPTTPGPVEEPPTQRVAPRPAPDEDPATERAVPGRRRPVPPDDAPTQRAQPGPVPTEDRPPDRVQPRPVPAEDPPTQRVDPPSRRSDPPSRRQKPPDDQLTIPLDRED